jgi:hypothetical protein
VTEKSVVTLTLSVNVLRPFPFVNDVATK